MMRQARVLVVAGSDSGGGAGLQADIKTITCLGGYAMTAVTAVTVQNTLGVQSVWPVPAGVVADQMRACLDDIGADVIKLGMLGSAEIADAVADVLAGCDQPLVLDPVMVASSGDLLGDESVLEVIVRRLLPRATIATPNLDELQALVETEVEDAADLLLAAQELLDLGPAAVLAKGGHLSGESVTDWLVWRGGQRGFTDPRIASRGSHGTGCTLASALAVSLAQGLSREDAVARARRYVRQALERAPWLGQGDGPLGFYPLEP